MGNKCIGWIIVLLAAVFQTRAQSIAYTNAGDKWNADSLGNIRAVVQVNSAGRFVRLILPWRRRDADPQRKKIIIQDAQTQARILNVRIDQLSREKAELLFEPVSGKGTYYLYYLPYRNEGRSNYPKGVYLPQDTTADEKWLASVPSAASVPMASCREIQSVDAFNGIYPMEVIATAAETALLVKKFPDVPYLVFPEDRQFPIRMKTDLPQRWIANGPSAHFNGTADQGENYTFQLGVFALKPLQHVQLVFSSLSDAKGRKIAAANLSCINTDGIAYNGLPLTNRVDVEAGNIQALWCAAKVPDEVASGNYAGTVTLTADGTSAHTISIRLRVSERKAIDGGVNEPWKMTRLHWLNSTLAQENDVIAPYTAIKITGDTLGILGRQVVLNAAGFPEKIQTWFTEEMTGFSQTPNPVLAAPIGFSINTFDGTAVRLSPGTTHFTRKDPGTVEWQSSQTGDALQMDVSGSLEFDGFIAYAVKFTALQDVDLQDISMHIPFAKTAAAYMMGLGQKGGVRPDSLVWTWDVAHKNQDGAWIGGVNAGLQYSLRDEHYLRPLNTNFYLQKPLLLPTSWGNENKGGIRIAGHNDAVMATNYSGSRSMKKGDVLYYNFTLLVTPFHPVNTEFQWNNRFYHRYNNLDSIKATGATVVNIHHATPINPWINYPFIEWKKMKGYIDSAHRLGLKVKIYNTIRELSDHAYETFALRSLGHEVYTGGKGGGFSWLQEHVADDYLPAWFVPEIKDAALVNSGMNRWHNYYVEGMNWLVQQVGIDGIYLDDVAFDRVTMKRIKRVLTRSGHPGIIDLHSANQYNRSDGFNNSAMLYMEHFPYLNRLWFGEYFDYEKNGPDFLLTEVSGIPFGLMGEMLQGDGNPYRGMLYGMTNRLGWSAESDPRPLWKAWNDAGISGTEMIGYWSHNCPVTTNNGKVLATVYKKKGMAIVSLASWADTTVQVILQIDWKKLQMDPRKATITAPAISHFQQPLTLTDGQPILVEKQKGCMLVIRE